MRHPSLPALLLAFLAGCSEAAKPPVAGPAPAPNVATDAAPVPAAGGPAPALPPAAPSYPETEEVQAILDRARELRDAGKFQEALAVADQARARDPNSPAAKALHGELTAIVTKI